MKLVTKRNTYTVDELPDGKLSIKINGEPFIHAGSLIKSYGGVKNVLAMCEESGLSTSERSMLQEKINKIRKVENETNKRRSLERMREIITENYKNLKKNEPIESTVENIRIVLAYLNTKNWGVWELPKMTISYKVAQYVCDERTASTMTLDEPLEIEGEKVYRFSIGAPRMYLTNYYHL